MEQNLTHLQSNSTNATQKKVSPLVRQFQRAAGLGKLSALLTQTIEPTRPSQSLHSRNPRMLQPHRRGMLHPRHPRVLLSVIQPQPLALHSLRSDSRQKPAGMTMQRLYA
jgi:hypothetical protein